MCAGKIGRKFMSLYGLTDPAFGRGENPRNTWSRLIHALDIADDTRRDPKKWHLARKIVESVRYAPDLSSEAFNTYLNHLQKIQPRNLPPAQVNNAADFLSHASPIQHRFFRRLNAANEPPKPYPYGMALPFIVGNQNDYSFLFQAAAALNKQDNSPLPRFHIFYDASKTRESRILARLLIQLAGQSYQGSVKLTVFGKLGGPMPTAPAGGPKIDHISHDILSEEARGPILNALDSADQIVFISGSAELDPTFLERAAWPARVTQRLVQPIINQGEQGKDVQISPYSLADIKQAFSSRYPFRDVAGLNLIVPSDLMRQVGPPDARFDSRSLASKELAFRLFNHGAWIAPVLVPSLTRFSDGARDDENRLYVGLAPNHWDRKTDGADFEVPKVSIYIPTYNASKYIERAVDSVLDQDLLDLEVCLANDGSYDQTLDLLERRYGEDKRVRWIANPNGGIGFASNTAITFARGLYIGQLDSDDCLKPGAVRRLAEYLDENPGTVCAYSSCERVDAAGNYIKDEYSWPEFSREKMMVTSIAHHFRMFRRSAWERTSKFREDIVNAVDYDIFLKLSETGQFHHVNEKLYQRRWHGENTSNVNEHHQTSNTYKVQTEALKRQGLDKFWKVSVVPDQDDPRRVTYTRKPNKPITMFWPDYSRSNPYQKLLYASARNKVEILSGDIDAAIRLIEDLPNLGGAAGSMTFHLHWLNFLFVGIEDPEQAEKIKDHFIGRLRKFTSLGGRLVWTIHNTLSHDSPFIDIERDLSEQIVELADTLHLHSEASIEEVEEAFALDRSKITISPHGSYVGTYPDFVTKDDARALLGYEKTDDIVLFTGQIRPYKGTNQLIEAMRTILRDRPKARLVLAGAAQINPLKELDPHLSDFEKSRIDLSNRFLDDMEMQVFFRAADIAVYPYNKVLTSGSLLLALSFGVPTVVPEVGMTRETLSSGPGAAGEHYSSTSQSLEEAIRKLLQQKDKGRLPELSSNARAISESHQWPDFTPLLMPSN